MANEKQKKAAKNVLSTERMDKGLSIKKILKKCPPYYKNTARDDVVVKKYNPNARTKGRHYAATAVCVSTTRKNATPHKCSVIGLDKAVSSLSSQKRVSISCDCEDWLYTFEYAMYTWGAASIKYSNGEPAVMKNPGNAIGACKHLCALMQLIIDQND